VKAGCLIVGVLALFVAGQARADQVLRETRLLCAPEDNVAVVQFREAYGAPVRWMRVPNGLDHGISARADAVSSGKECVLKNGTRIEFEQGADQAYPYGFCGGAPDAWINLWIDRKRVFRHRPFAGCQGQYLHSVVIGAKEITLCRFADKPDGRPSGGNESRPVVCEPLAQISYPGLPDYDRYPPSGGAPQSGVYLRYAAVPADRCRRLQKAEKSTQYLLGVNRFDVDIDNDGQVDRVFVVSSRTHADDGDRLYVVNGDLPNEKVLTGDARQEALEQADEALGKVSDFSFSGVNTIMEERYSYVEVMTVDGRSFVSVVADDETRTVANIIFEGEPVQRLRTVCVFARQ
jgi:hypothetical protein